MMYRHNEAHRIMVNAVYKGRKGTLLIVADVSTAVTLGNLSVHHKPTPERVLPC